MDLTVIFLLWSTNSETTPNHDILIKWKQTKFDGLYLTDSQILRMHIRHAALSTMLTQPKGSACTPLDQSICERQYQIMIF